MASLKEIKSRIASINSTQKITAAMKMVSSAKLHHTQAAAEHMLAYSKELSGIFKSLLADCTDVDSPLLAKRDIGHIAVVVFSSNNGLCGGFNANIWKALQERILRYEAQHVRLSFFPVGKSVAKELAKAGYACRSDFLLDGEQPTFDTAVKVSHVLQGLFLSGEVDKVELLYHHFHNMARQDVTCEGYLPSSWDESKEGKGGNGGLISDYILEPSAEELLNLLFPKMLDLQVYTVLLDAATSEHAARMMAMQTANDNANELIGDLTLQYNKTRQQAITNELLDIMGGSRR